MTPQQLLGVGVRLFAIWMALNSVAYFTSVPMTMNSMPELGGAVAIAYLIGAAYVLGAWALWCFPLVIAQFLLPKTKLGNHLSLNAHELARVGSSLIGLWVFAQVMPQLVRFVFRAFVTTNQDASFSTLDAVQKLNLAVAVFELVFAAFLVTKSRVFAGLVVPEVKASSAADPEL
jgi:hypothetical protein